MGLQPKAPTVACSPSNVLCGAASLAVNDALRFAPLFPDFETLQDLSITAFDEIEAIRIRMNGDPHCELAKNAAAVATDEPEECGLNLKEPSAGATLDRQVKEQMAVNDVSVRLALAAPHTRQTTDDSLPEEPFVESFTDFGEELAAGIVKHDRARPMNGRMRNQGKAYCSRMIDGLDEVGCLVEGEVLAAVRTVAASLLLAGCCIGAYNR
jgi:hypothetical protein